MANAFQILVEILTFLIRDAWLTLAFVGSKLAELFVALTEIASQNFLGLLIASVFGGVVIYFALKFIFKTTKFFIGILILYIILLVIAFGLLT